MREGARRSGATVLQTQSFYQRQERLIWWFVLARIGQDLRARYQAAEELPAKLLALLVRLDAAEENYVLRYEPPLKRRSVAENDWLPPKFVWQSDADLFAG
jgi:hypothetical protein